MAATNKIKSGMTTLRVHLRSVRHDDCELLLEWQTEEVRRYFHNPDPPTPLEHREWFGRRFARQKLWFWIIEMSATPVGYVRLDETADPNEAVVSVLVHKLHQGRGAATAVLLELRKLVPTLKLRASIHPQNSASRRTFAKAGYRILSQELMISDAVS